jgi:FtsH-binding integral membrane protein
MRQGGGISIWFFIGISLLVNGVLICGAGVYQYFNPPEKQLVLYQLHAGIWWGAILAILGAVYCFYFAPGKSRS